MTQTLLGRRGFVQSGSKVFRAVKRNCTYHDARSEFTKTRRTHEGPAIILTLKSQFC